MNKKILSIIFSLFLVGVFSISCSNAEQQTNPKGIEQYNGNTYVSTETFDASGFDPSLNPAYMWVSIKDSKVGIYASIDNNTEPTYQGYMNVEGSGTDYTFDSGDGIVAGTLKFTDASVTVNFTKNTAESTIVGQDIVCNKK